MKNLRNKIAFIILLILIALIFFLTPAQVTSSQIVLAPQVTDQAESIHTTVTDDHAVHLAKAIAIAETGGTLDCSKTGLSGEKGCHQFLPSTWVSYSKEVYGYVEVQTPERATFVTESMIRKWKGEGLSDRQILLIWNQGNTSPCKAGTNKYGVKYDSCAYVENVLSILQEVIHRK